MMFVACFYFTLGLSIFCIWYRFSCALILDFRHTFSSHCTGFSCGKFPSCLRLLIVVSCVWVPEFSLTCHHFQLDSCSFIYYCHGHHSSLENCVRWTVLKFGFLIIHSNDLKDHIWWNITPCFETFIKYRNFLQFEPNLKYFTLRGKWRQRHRMTAIWQNCWAPRVCKNKCSARNS